MGDPVSFEIRDSVAYATIDHPPLNSIDEDVLAGLAGVVRQVERPDVRALVLGGAGEAFCVGLDIGLLGRAFADHAYFRSVLERYRDVLLGLEATPVPVVAAVNGLARAGGFELILACDLVTIASEARIGDTHLAFGLMPGGGATARAPRRLGWQRAADLVLSGRWIDGEEAVRLGVASRSVPRASLDAAVEEVAGRFRTLSRPALAATKATMRAGLDVTLRGAVDLEIERFISFLAAEPSAAEGYRAYVEKRAPVWD